MSGSLKRRLVAAACVWVVALTVAGGIALSAAFRSSVTRAFDESLADELRNLIAGVETATDGTWWLSRPPDDARYRSIFSGRYWQITNSTDREERSRSLWDSALPELPELPERRVGRIAAAFIDGPAKQPLRMAAQAVSLPHLEQPLDFRVAFSRSALDAEIARFDRLAFVALSLLAAGLVVAVWLQVGYGLRPLRRIANELHDVRTGSKDRLSDDHPSEIRPLVRELESVLSHNRRLIERARSSSADLAHALKTPLSVMAAELHAPGKDWREVMARELDRTHGLVNRHLSRTAIAGAGRGRMTLLAPVIADILQAMRRIHAERTIMFESAISDDVAFAGEREDLEEMLGNLIDNAGKWARSRVHVRARAEGGVLSVEIADDGPGLPSAQRGDAVQRGRRFDEMTPGNGLGLAIVGDIAESYDGRLELETSSMGGLLAVLVVPGA